MNDQNGKRSDERNINPGDPLASQNGIESSPSTQRDANPLLPSDPPPQASQASGERELVGESALFSAAITAETQRGVAALAADAPPPQLPSDAKETLTYLQPTVPGKGAKARKWETQAPQVSKAPTADANSTTQQSMVRPDLRPAGVSDPKRFASIERELGETGAAVKFLEKRLERAEKDNRITLALAGLSLVLAAIALFL